MSQSKNYQKTMYACFIGYIVQAVVNNFVPLLFVVFQDSYHIPLSQITALITINFLIQLGVDLLSAGVVDKLGYRTCVLLAHGCAAAGLVLLAFLPDLLPNPFAGILIAVGIYAVGGGLIEVLISPILEACPTKNKEKAMSLLHSFYCWGHVGVVLISTVFFRLAGVGNWRILTVLWALIPVGNLVLFAGAPIYSLHEEGETGLTLRELFTKKIFWILMLMMLCAGASEQAVGQWASIFAEKGLGVSKTVGDLAGPMAFAALMGTSRLIYGKYGDRLNLNRFMTLSCFLCIAAYGCISLIPNAADWRGAQCADSPWESSGRARSVKHPLLSKAAELLGLPCWRSPVIWDAPAARRWRERFPASAAITSAWAFWRRRSFRCCCWRECCCSPGRNL